MAKNQTAVTGLRNQPAIQTIELALRVADAIAGAPHIFINPTPGTLELKNLALDTKASYQEAQGGSVLQRQKFKNNLEKLKKLLTRMCYYVNCVASGDTDKLLASGFSLSRLPEINKIPTVVTRLDAFYINKPGEVLLKWQGSKNHRYFVIQVSTDPSDAGSWKDIASITGRQYLVSNLNSGVRHYFRMVSVGVHKASVPSDMASVMVA